MINKKGFTLIEVVLYVSMVSIMVFVISSFFAVMVSTNAKNHTIIEVESQGTQLMQIISQTIRNSTGVTSPTIGTTGQSLTLTLTDGTKSPTIFDLSGGVLRIKEGLGSVTNLSSNRVTISNLTFSNLSRTGTKGLIRYQFTISHLNSSGRGELNYQQTFYGSSAIR